MKRIFSSLLLMATVINLSAETLTYEMVQNATDPKKELAREYDEYVASDKHTYKVGDKLTIGNPHSNKTYAFLISELAMASNILGGGNAQLAVGCVGKKMEIKSIKVERKKKSGSVVKMRCYLSGIGGVLVSFENAIQYGEIEGQGMSRDKALEELKKLKDLRDLEVITADEYEAKKAELMPFLK